MDQDAQQELLRLVEVHGGQMATARLLTAKGLPTTNDMIRRVLKKAPYPKDAVQRARRDAWLPILKAAEEELRFTSEDFARLLVHAFGPTSLARQLGVTPTFVQKVRRGVSHLSWEHRMRCKKLLAAPGRDFRREQLVRNTLEGDDHGRYQIYRPGTWRERALDSDRHGSAGEAG